jgi:hypothetical protein
MSSNKRRHRRQARERRAILRALDGGHISDCTVSDISAGGARVTLDRTGPLPQAFTLCLTNNGNVYRECKVAWRRESVIGVQFVDGARTATPIHYVSSGIRHSSLKRAAVRRPA